jgi:hypothetical protein
LVTVTLLFVTVPAGTAACAGWTTAVLFVVLVTLPPDAPDCLAAVTVVLDEVTEVPLLGASAEALADLSAVCCDAATASCAWVTARVMPSICVVPAGAFAFAAAAAGAGAPAGVAATGALATGVELELALCPRKATTHTSANRTTATRTI